MWSTTLRESAAQKKSVRSDFFDQRAARSQPPIAILSLELHKTPIWHKISVPREKDFDRQNIDSWEVAYTLNHVQL